MNAGDIVKALHHLPADTPVVALVDVGIGPAPFELGDPEVMTGDDDSDTVVYFGTRFKP